MKYLLVSVGTAGDVFPLIGVGRALSRRGHEVRLATLRRYKNFVEGAQLPFVELSGLEGAFDHPDFYHPTRSMQVAANGIMLPAIKPVYELAAQLDPREWTLLVDAYSYGARIVNEQKGTPLITYIVTPFMLRSVEAMPVTPGFALGNWAPRFLRRGFFSMVSGLWDKALGPQLNSFRRSLGMAPVRDIFYHWSLSTQRIVGLFPEWYAPRPSDWPAPFQYGGFTVYDQSDRMTLPAEVEALSDRNPLVIFAAGSAGQIADRFFEQAVEASRGRPWQAVLLAPTWKPSAPLPENVLACGYVPLRRLLSRSSLIVHHGGTGTLSLSLAAGIPQLLMPFGHDQFDNGVRIEKLGAGRSLPRSRKTASQVSKTIEELLADKAVLKRCSELAPLANPDASIERVCNLIDGSKLEAPVKESSL